MLISPRSVPAALAQSNPQSNSQPDPQLEHPSETTPDSADSQYDRYEVSGATVHVVILTDPSEISVAAADTLEPLSVFAEREGATYALNAGFFDPQNGKTTSYLTVSGQVVGNPEDNERLIGNPDLQEYLPQILNRSEFRVYACQPDSDETVVNESALIRRYAITTHDGAIRSGCRIEHSVGAGPQLLPVDTSEAEAFTAYEAGELIRDAIGSTQPNAPQRRRS